MTRQARDVIADAECVRFRTLQHPAARDYPGALSYDEWYDESQDFAQLYERIVQDLGDLSQRHDEVVYVVPGSPMVAEQTVQLLLASRTDVLIDPAVSIIDVSCTALGVDPMAINLTVTDALEAPPVFRGPGPILVLQAYLPEVLAMLAERIPVETVTVLHHVGLEDQRIERIATMDLWRFPADHLTSLWIPPFRDAGMALSDLVDFLKILRRECPWDEEQTHASLVRHLLEESYEVIDAIEVLVRSEEAGNVTNDHITHVEEELGDLLFQILFHSEIASEEGQFDIATVADALRDKLTFRHPHVFGDVTVNSSDEVASRWEELKKEEKGRSSITEGIAWDLPALTLYTKLLRKANTMHLDMVPASELRERAQRALAALTLAESPSADSTAQITSIDQWGVVLESITSLAQQSGIDAESVLRSAALNLRDRILHEESKGPASTPLVD
jgi:tetrapyrrole methylase family protein / MazG family protein